MHAVMLTNAIAPDKLGGLERYVRELSAALVEAGVAVTAIAKQMDSTHPLDEVGDDGVRILRYRMPAKSDPTFAARYPAAVARGVSESLERAGKHDILHGHFPVPVLPVAIRRLPYVYTLHAPVYRELLRERQGSYLLPAPAQKPAEALLRSAERLVVKRASRIITLSAFMKNEVAVLDGAAAQRTDVLAGGVDTDRFAPDPAAISGGEGPLIFTARRLVPRTGVAELVQAMPAILAAVPSTRLAIAGSGLQQDQIAAEIRRLGLGDQVQMLGRVSDDALVNWYRRADLVVTPTQELEGFGLATAEALACGTPCLVTPAGANPELVEDVSPHLIASDTSPAAIAAAAIRLLRSDELAELAPRCRPAAHPQMGWAAIAQRHLQMYTSIA